MSYSLSKKEYESVLKLSADERYDYFIRQVQSTGEIWSLANAEGWVAFSSEGDACLPVWPHPDFARLWATADWADCKPEMIEINTWLERWVPGMEADESLVVVFPDDQEEGIIVSPSEVGVGV